MNINHLFKDLKDGDCLGFYHTKFYYIFSKIIALCSGYPMDHIATVIIHTRTDQEVLFWMYESTLFHGIRKVLYYVSSDGRTNLDVGKHRKLYYIPSKKLKNDQVKTAIADLNSQIGQKYDFFGLFLVPFNNILSKLYKIYKKRHSPSSFCSKYILKNKLNIGVITKKEYEQDELRTPYQVACLSCMKGIYEIESSRP